MRRPLELVDEPLVAGAEAGVQDAVLVGLVATLVGEGVQGQTGSRIDRHLLRLVVEVVLGVQRPEVTEVPGVVFGLLGELLCERLSVKMKAIEDLLGR